MFNWINGYSLDLNNKSLESLLIKNSRLRFKWSYEENVKLNLIIIKTQDTLDHLKNIEFLERRQKESLRLMDKFGIRFTQKYDFEAVKLIVKDLKENTKREAEAKAKNS